MTVYLKGKNGRDDIVEKNVKSVEVDADYIKVTYRDRAEVISEWCVVAGREYFTEQMQIDHIEE